MSNKGTKHTHHTKRGASFFSLPKSIFSRLGKEEKSLALIASAAVALIAFTSQVHLPGYIQFGIPIPVFLLLFEILFARKPKNPV